MILMYTRMYYVVFLIFFNFLCYNMYEAMLYNTKTKSSTEYFITNAGDREFGILNGSSFQLGHTALAGDQIDGCFKLP